MFTVGFSNQSVALFEFYLSNRRTQINLWNKYSNITKIDCGVPQGSILRPLLFSVQVNNMF